MSQITDLVKWLTPPGRKITKLQALNKFGIMNMGGRAFDLGKMGYPIDSKMVYKTNGKKWAEYFFK